ncbi:hypothetical protein H5410_031412 [Solanum commersonii]|uniref:Uncharacterized protein n=1 Tax=Solanum commersonii TaxID=4109 RepID=A0A9J5YI90_SOLCO|nr:hypothetical protein H5410_031412 [Solanum commersonii]
MCGALNLSTERLNFDHKYALMLLSRDPLSSQVKLGSVIHQGCRKPVNNTMRIDQEEHLSIRFTFCMTHESSAKQRMEDGGSRAADDGHYFVFNQDERGKEKKF